VKRLFTRYYLEHPEDVELDYDSRLFYMLHSTTTPLVFDASGQVHVAGVGAPGVLHANAGDGKSFYESMVRAWRAAVRDRTSTIAANLPYFRGIAHHQRQEAALALASFAAHTANGSKWVGESCYNAGFILHSFGEVGLARLLYLRSMQLEAQVADRAANNLAVVELSAGNSSFRAAQTAIAEALGRDPDDGQARLLKRTFQATYQAHTSGSGVATHPVRQPDFAWSVPAVDAAYDLRSCGAYVHEVLDGYLTPALAETAERTLGLAGAFERSRYVEAASLLCQRLGYATFSTGELDFSWARVLEVFHYLGESDSAALCDVLYGRPMNGTASAVAGEAGGLSAGQAPVSSEGTVEVGFDEDRGGGSASLLGQQAPLGGRPLSGGGRVKGKRTSFTAAFSRSTR
jgi:hypothetical protein